MPKIKTSELIDAPLDWAVAVSINGEPVFFDILGTGVLGRRIVEYVLNNSIRPSKDWCQGGPLLTEYISMHQIFSKEPGMKFQAKSGAHYGFGNSILEAACRAIVSAHFGDEVDIPEELV